MYSCGPFHMDKLGLGNQLEPIYNCSVLIQDVAWKTFLEWSMIDRWWERVREIYASGEFLIEIVSILVNTFSIDLYFK